MSNRFLWASAGSLLVVLVGLSAGPLFADNKDAEYVKSLENALLAQINERRGGDHAAPSVGSAQPALPAAEKTVLPVNLLKSDEGNEVSAVVVADVKQSLKEPFLTLLASSEFVSWAEFKKRLEDAKAALNSFEVKHKADLDKVVAAGQRPAIPTAPQGMPGIVPIVKPGAPVKPVKSDNDDDEEDDDDDKKKPAVPVAMPTAGGMPGVKPAGMPGVIKPAAAPAPTSMPGAVKPVMPGVAVPAAMPTAKTSGMPLAK